jgi:Divergent InlB B-repeat domain
MMKLVKLFLGTLLIAMACGGASSSVSTPAPPAQPPPAQPPVQMVPLNLSLSGPGSAEVRTSKDQSVCSGSCTVQIENGSTVLIVPHPEGGSTFTGFAGDCSGIADCSLIVNSTINVTINFASPPPPPPKKHVLSVTRTGNGVCTVTADAIGIDCGSHCQENADADSDVVLVVQPDKDSAFTGWQGACDGKKDPTCTARMDKDLSVSARCMKIVCSVDP